MGDEKLIGIEGISLGFAGTADAVQADFDQMREMGLFDEGIKPVYGVLVHHNPGKGGQLVKSAGTVAQVMAHESGYTLVRLPSGEMRRIISRCVATVGQVSNLDYKNQKLGKAGRNRHRGYRPTVRGSAMSPSAHPHGGGEGRSGIGMPGPKTPWGKPALGHRTRKNRSTDKFILRRR